MRRILRWLVSVPVAAVLVVLALANRGTVTLSLDPFPPADPALSITAPMFVVAFVILIVGIIIGGAAAWARQGRWRRAAREAERLRREDVARRASEPPLLGRRDQRRAA